MRSYMKKNFFYIIILLFISCSYIDDNKNKLINDIINNPKDVKKICYSSPFKLSGGLKSSLTNNPEVLIKHFSKYNKKYKILDEWHTDDSKDVLYVRVFVSDANKENMVAFDFIKKKGNWILYNILLEKF
ncbi:MAG: hypothetical protein A2176_09930 [Spirochaetes bacterium RBG_13_51_14]|nr:MAG: hypothetical protein A2176_09930 [Spirochaetes bacterium RBG_13_51_14]